MDGSERPVPAASSAYVSLTMQQDAGASYLLDRFALMRRLCKLAVAGAMLLLASLPYAQFPSSGRQPPSLGSAYDSLFVHGTLASNISPFPGWEQGALAEVLFHALAATGQSLSEGVHAFKFSKWDHLSGSWYGLETGSFAGNAQINIFPSKFLKRFLGLKEPLDYSFLNTPTGKAHLYIAVVHELHHRCRNNSGIKTSVKNYSSDCEELAVMQAGRSSTCSSAQQIACDIEALDQEIAIKELAIAAKQIEIDEETDDQAKQVLEQEKQDLEDELDALNQDRVDLEASRAALCDAVNKENEAITNPPPDENGRVKDWDKELAKCLVSASMAPPEGFQMDPSCPQVSLPAAPPAGSPLLPVCPCCEGGSQECGGCD